MGTLDFSTWTSLALAAAALASALLAFRQSFGEDYRRPWLLLGFSALAAATAGGVVFYSLWVAVYPQMDTPTATAGLLSALFLAAGLFDLSREMRMRRAVEASRARELDLLRHGFQNSDELLVIKDEKGVYLAANQAFATFLGKSLENILGHSDFDFFPRSLANNIRQEEERLLAGGGEKEGLEELRGAAGVRSMRVRRIALKDAAGNFFGIMLAAQDVTSWSQDAARQKLDNQMLEQLNDATVMLVGAGSGAELCRTIVDAARLMTGSEHVCLWLVDEGSKTLVAQAGTGKLHEPGGIRIKPGEDLPGKVWQTSQEVVAANYSGWSRRNSALAKLEFVSAAAVPVKAETHILGVIGVYFDGEKKELSGIALARLSQFAGAAALALERSRASEVRDRELEERNQAMVQYQFRLRLERLVAALAARFIQVNATKVDEAVNRSLQSIAKFSGVELVYIALLPTEEQPRPAKLTIFSSQPDESMPASLETPEIQWLLSRLSQLEMIHIPRRSDRSGESDESASYMQARGLVSVTALPMIANRSLIGYFCLESKSREQDWPAEILALFKVCAEMYVSVLERKWSAEELQARMKKADLDKASIERRAQESALIAEMGDLLQACRTADEAYPIIARYANRLLPQSSGALYLVRHAADPAENVVSWGDAPPGAGERDLGPNDCWGLRRGRLHAVQLPESEPICTHVHEPYPASYVCVPLLAQGTAAGVLHIRQNEIQAEMEPLNGERQQLATRVAEYVALALTNLNLRDTLRSQAIRDPLTGLFNRRYMEETLEREIRRANRHGTSVGIIMFDIDRMKPINDGYGHDAGDVLLRTLGELMLSSFRGEDVACRYGGDEFTIVLPEASLVDVWRRAEQLRESVKKLDIKYEGRSIGAITLSIGVAAYPDHGLTAERVLLAADAASYASKSEGGDRIMVGHEGDA